MEWVKKFTYVPQYELASGNQHGNRFKYKGTKKLSVAKMSCSYDASSNEMLRLILLSNTLDVPIRYDYDKHEASIEVVGAEALKGATCS